MGVPADTTPTPITSAPALQPRFSGICPGSPAPCLIVSIFILRCQAVTNVNEELEVVTLKLK